MTDRYARLKKLIAFMEELPRERFDFDTWVGDDWGGKQNLSCGTVACALGWACTIPAFRRAGLRLDFDGVPFLKDGRGPGREAVGEEAGRMFFNLPISSAQLLFLGPERPSRDENSPVQTPKRWARMAKKELARLEAFDE